MYLATADEGNELLARDPLALLIGMLLDQQIPMEKAFTSPSVLAERLGVARLNASDLAEMEPTALAEIFRRPPALHRYPVAMAERTQAMCRALVERYDADAAAVWRSATAGTDLVARIGKLPGFGVQKAAIFAALLGKQFGVQPDGWREATGDYGLDGYRSIADVVDADSLNRVRAFKQEKKAAARLQGPTPTVRARRTHSR